MTFADAQLQECYNRNITNRVPGLPEELREVSALFAVHAVFFMLEGPHSSRVHEMLDRLLAPAVRPALRQWYQRTGLIMDSATAHFREHLNDLAGERLQDAVEGACNPS